MNWLELVKAILGIAEEVVPIFIHNPQSQRLEGVVITTVNHVMAGLQQPPKTN